MMVMDMFWMRVGFAVAFLFGASLLALAAGPTLACALHRLNVQLRSNRFGSVVVLALVGILIAYGGDKPTPPPTPPEPPRPAGVEELWTNDVAFVSTAAHVYDGFLTDAEGNLVGPVLVTTAKKDKNGKVKITATATVNGKKKSMSVQGVSLGKNGMTGSWGTYAVFGALRVKPKTAYVKNWTVAFANGDWVQLKVDSKGAVKFAGSAKGKAYSGSARLVVGDGFAYVPVVSGANRTLVRIGSDGAVSVVSSASGEMDEGGVTAKPRFEGWNASANTMVGVAYKGSPVMNGLAWPMTFKASKLPTGCKINSKTGVISGVPTKTGTFLTKVTATSASNKKWTATYVVTNKIAALPEWARGQFAGTADGNALTMTVGSTGKVSGKFKQGATNWTFSATSFTSASQTAASPIALVCSATAKGTYTVGSGKSKKTKTVTAPISFALAADPDVSPIASSGTGDFSGGTDNVAIWRAAGVRLSVDGVKGGTVKMDKSYGQVASGKSVKLTVKLTKGYAFLGWFDALTDERLSLSTAYSLKMSGADRIVVARFAKESALTASDFTLVWNAPTNLFVGVSYSAKPSVTGIAAVKIASVSGLPKGLSCKSGKVSGVPTTVKTNTVSVTFALATNAKKKFTLKQRLVVMPLPDWAAQSFTGNLGTEETPIPVSLTISSKGKVSGKYKQGGVQWTFSAANLSSVACDGTTGEPTAFAASVTASATVNKKKKTRKLVVTVTEEGADIHAP